MISHPACGNGKSVGGPKLKYFPPPTIILHTCVVKLGEGGGGGAVDFIRNFGY